MDEELIYLKDIVEGKDNLEPWPTWFARHEGTLSQGLTRTEFLDLRLNRIKAIPRILGRFKIAFVPSSKYDWLGGGTDRCRDCGATVDRDYWGASCPNGCFIVHAHPPPPRRLRRMRDMHGADD